MGAAKSQSTRKTSKAKKPKKSVAKGEPPSQEKWESMQVYRSFVVPGDDEKEHKFEKEEIVLILPTGADPTVQHDISTYWVAKIKDIRAEVFADGANSVWVKVQWYYSGKDVSNVIKSFDAKAVGSYERIFSDHYDFVQPEAFDAVIPLYKFSEIDPLQPYIPSESFYRRYTFEYRARNLKPRPGSSHGTGCLCGLPYNPNDDDPAKLIHFCPRPSCRRGFHEACLVQAGCKEKIAPVKAKTTVKIPRFAMNRDDREVMGEDKVVRVMRSARKHTVPPPKRNAKIKPQDPEPTSSSQKTAAVDEEKEVIKVIFPPPLTLSGLSNLDEVDELGLSLDISNPESITLSARALRLLACSPDTDSVVDLETFIPTDDDDADAMEVDGQEDADGDTDDDDDVEGLPKKRRRGRPAKKTRSSKRTKATSKPKSKSKNRKTVSTSTTLAPPPDSRMKLSTLLSTLPPTLLLVATQPLVRGGAFSAGGVAGNIGPVCEARLLVYAALRKGGGKESVPAEWEDMVFGEERKLVGVGVNNVVVEMWQEDDKGRKTKTNKMGSTGIKVDPFLCPECKSAI